MSNSKANLALYAHAMRQAPTDSEARLWRALRSSQLGVAFRRQVPLLGFIADFYAQSQRLIVEVDGGYQGRRTSADARRDRTLRAGYRVLRIEATRVMRDLPAVVADVLAASKPSTWKPRLGRGCPSAAGNGAGAGGQSGDPSDSDRTAERSAVQLWFAADAALAVARPAQLKPGNVGQT